MIDARIEKKIGYVQPKTHCTKIKFCVKDFFINVRKSSVFAYLFTFIGKVLSGKFHFWCSVF